MRICVAQTIPVKGDIEKNIEAHTKIIHTAVTNNADIIVFPELSLTGFEPALAHELATTKNDERLGQFQIISTTQNISICVGLPTKDDNDVFISMLIFQPNKSVEIYSKQYLHDDEFAIFTPGKQQLYLNHENIKLALAICYETSVAAHAKNAFNNNVNVYLSSVLNSKKSIEKDLKRLSEIAKNYHMIVFMANYAGMSGGYDCAGKSSVWDKQGNLIAQLDSENEGILIYDSNTGEILKETFAN